MVEQLLLVVKGVEVLLTVAVEVMAVSRKKWKDKSRRKCAAVGVSVFLAEEMIAAVNGGGDGCTEIT